MTKEYLLVLPVDPMRCGDEYASGELIPLHCTLMHWFTFRRISAMWLFKQQLQEITNECEPFELVSDQPAMLGPDMNVPVHVLERNQSLAVLHTRIFRLLCIMRSEPSELRWVGAGYRPHVTNVGAKRFVPASRHSVDHIALVERNESKIKRVDSMYWLKGVK